MRNQVAHERGQRLFDRLAAGEDHQHAEAHDLVVGQLLAVDLDMGQHGQQPGAGGPAALGDQRTQICVQLVTRGEASGCHFGIADQVDPEPQ